MFTIGGLSGVTHAVVAGRHPADRHLLHRRPLPLRAVRWRLLRLHRRLLLLVAEGVRHHAQRDARQVELLAHAASASTSRSARCTSSACRACRGASTPTTAGYGFDVLEHGRHHRRVHPGRRRPAVPLQHLHSTPTRSPRNAPLDPWDARTIEWMTTSPPKPHNFDAIPTVTRIDEFWHRKYAETEDGHGCARSPPTEEVMADQERTPTQHIHLPSPSYWPIVRRLRPADHRLRPDLQPRGSRVRRRAHRRSAASTAGRSSRRRAPSAARRRPDGRHDGAEHGSWPTVGRRRRPTPTSVDADEPRPCPSTTTAARPATAPPRTHTTTGHLQQQAGDVAVPRRRSACCSAA